MSGIGNIATTGFVLYRQKSTKKYVNFYWLTYLLMKEKNIK